MTAVERVARAIATANNKVCWPELTAAQRRPDKHDIALFMPEARAAIKALREPSEVMIMAATIGDVEASWIAMIDAALEEGP